MWLPPGACDMEKTMTYKGKTCTSSEVQVGDTIFTVISVQSDSAKETAQEKVKRLILANAVKGNRSLPA